MGVIFEIKKSSVLSSGESGNGLNYNLIILKCLTRQATVLVGDSHNGSGGQAYFAYLCLMLPRQHPPASTSGPLNSQTIADPQITDQICREYLRGNCTKYGQCRHRHELDINLMKEILQFCHNYQNRNGCTRVNCKYLHASKEEQNTFLATGKIPRVLAERRAALDAAASNMHSNAETIPQIAMFISESYMSQPPPAPWPPLPPQQGALPPPATAPPPPPAASPPRHAAGPSGPPAQQLSLPPAAAPGVGQLRPAAAYSAMPSSVLFSMDQPAAAVVPEKFDPSKPPPPLPSHMQPTNNGQLKRKVDANGNAASTKIRKPDGPEVSEQRCESCAQRELRIEGYKHQMEAMHNEEETQILLYKKKLNEYEIGRNILKKLVGPELFAVFDNLIEGTQQPQQDSPGSLIAGSSTLCKEAVLHLFRVLLEGGARNVIDPAPSTSHVDDRLQSLTSMARRHNVASYSNNAGPDLVKCVAEILKNSAAERSTDQEVPGEMLRTNGYLANGQKPQTSTSEPARYGAQPAYAGPSVTVAHQAMPGPYTVAGPSGYASGGPPPAAPPGGYMYHPGIPPPNRHYYPQNPAVSGTGGMPYNGTERAPGPAPGPAQAMQAPAAPGALRVATNAPNYNYTNMTRYPQPPYFPPYQ